jgi:hypothetical protein
MAELSADEVLYAAADLIEVNGLHQGDYWPGAGEDKRYVLGDPTCTFGACAVVLGVEYPWAADMPDVVEDITDTLGEVVGEWVPGWNDAPDQTAERVVSVLRACALMVAARREPLDFTTQRSECVH